MIDIAQPISDVLAAELAEQARWSTQVPSWHPRAESEGGTPAGVEGGQGEAEADGGDALYSQYLAGAPQELHPMVLEALKAQNSDFTRKFQDAAQFRSRWEPISKIDGFSDLKPEDIEFHTGLHKTFQDPDATREWVGQLTELLGMETGQLDQEAWQALGETNGWAAGEAQAEGQGQPDISAIVEAVREALAPDIGPVKEYVDNQKQTESTRQQLAAFEGRYTDLVAEHGLIHEGMPPEDAAEVKSAVVALAQGHLDHEDPLGQAVQQYLKITGGAQGDLIDDKLQSRRGPSLASGQAGNGPETPSWIEGNGPSPKDLALARFR